METATAVKGRGRPRGFAPWNPQNKTVVVLDQVRQILDEYADHLPLTNRQLFYRLVGNFDFPKRENDYARLCEYLNRGRRAGMIPWDAIRDDGQTEHVRYFDHAEPRHWLERRIPSPVDYMLDPQADQPVHTEVWCEAAGMVPMLARMTFTFGIGVYSAGGFSSVTALHDAAGRMKYRDVPTRVLHLGDYDPSGVSIFEAAAADVTAFGADVEFVRIALTPAIIDRLNLPSVPPKSHDKRAAFTDTRTVQLEAVAPDDLDVIVTTAIRDRWDVDAAQATRDRQAEARAELRELIDAMFDGGDRG